MAPHNIFNITSIAWHEVGSKMMEVNIILHELLNQHLKLANYGQQNFVLFFTFIAVRPDK